MSAERWIVTGRVQGVGYRDWLVAAARAEDLAGWCRNRDDGSVELRVNGTPASLDRLARRCAGGPPLARVDAVRRTPCEDEDLPLPFGRR